MRVEVGGKYILPVAELQNLGAMGELHNHFDLNIGPAPPWFGGLWPPPFRRVQRAYKFEKGQCLNVARAFARKLLRKRNVATLAPNLRISQGVIANASPASSASQTPWRNAVPTSGWSVWAPTMPRSAITWTGQRKLHVLPIGGNGRDAARIRRNRNCVSPNLGESRGRLPEGSLANLSGSLKE